MEVSSGETSTVSKSVSAPDLSTIEELDNIPIEKSFDVFPPDDLSKINTKMTTFSFKNVSESPIATINWSSVSNDPHIQRLSSLWLKGCIDALTFKVFPCFKGVPPTCIAECLSTTTYYFRCSANIHHQLAAVITTINETFISKQSRVHASESGVMVFAPPYSEKSYWIRKSDGLLLDTDIACRVVPYTCIACQREVRPKQQALQCDGCEQW